MKYFENSKEKQPEEQNKRKKDDLSGLLEIELHCSKIMEIGKVKLK